jgi:hypothetical protein
MKRRSMAISMLVCGVCGSRFFVPRSRAKLREKGHIKDIYCYVCKEVTKFTELGIKNL